MTVNQDEGIAEFSFTTKYQTKQTKPGGWIFSHAIRQWQWILVALIGAISNADPGKCGPNLHWQGF
jgi:hypothetical protein